MAVGNVAGAQAKNIIAETMTYPSGNFLLTNREYLVNLCGNFS